jgi:hypothetical protein
MTRIAKPKHTYIIAAEKGFCKLFIFTGAHSDTDEMGD